ncbi:MAG: molybdenum cofactor guanylyltransferase [Nitrospirales bacterium]|nr:molybdenum cofactor guanylyltransferase [Nitrospirales bacterium]
MSPANGKAAGEWIAGAVLAGGENRRFPVLKGFIEIEGVPLIRRNVDLLKGLFREVLISTNMPEHYFFLGVPMVGDVLPSRGPMSGIYSCLLNAGGDAILVSACDMPFLRGDVVALLCEEHRRASASGRVDVTVPVYDGKPQPLLGVYAKTALPFLEEGIMNGRTSMKRFFGEASTHFVGESALRTLDPGGRSFININTPEDFQRVSDSSPLAIHSTIEKCRKPLYEMP